MRSFKTALLVLSVAVAPSIAGAQAAAPDYSGTFVLDPAQSQQSPVVPMKLSLTIKQSPADIQVTRVQATPAGENTAALRFTLGSEASVNQAPGPNGPMKVTTKVTQDGGSTVFTSDTDIGVHQVDKWTLIEGGKKLQIDRAVTVNEQNLSGRMVLVRQ